MNVFAKATSEAIERNGLSSTYKSVTQGTYDVNAGSVTNTETSYTVKIYMKNLNVNQFNYPNLIGKDTGIFYLYAGGLAFVPKPQDLIIFNSKTYKVDSVQSHAAQGSIVLYRIIGVV